MRMEGGGAGKDRQELQTEKSRQRQIYRKRILMEELSLKLVLDRDGQKHLPDCAKMKRQAFLRESDQKQRSR